MLSSASLPSMPVVTTPKLLSEQADVEVGPQTFVVPSFLFQ